MTKRKTVAFFVTMLLLSGVACIKKSNGTTPTPWEKVATYNAAFADLNNTIEKGVEAVNLSGVMSKQQAEPILLWTSQVAVAHQQITALIAQGSVTSADLTSIQGLLAQIKASGNSLIANGALGIKNPQSQQTFAADFNSLYTLADTIVSLLTTLKTGA